MTDPVNKVDGVKETSRKNSRDELFGSNKHRHHSEQLENDNVDISEEARDKASGKKRKNILEYIES
jgi:hypothetical protein